MKNISEEKIGQYWPQEIKENWGGADFLKFL